MAGQDITKSPLGRHPIGTGPYIFKEWRAGEKIALAFNPDYFEGRPYLNGYLYLVKPDTATMFLELKAGNLDRMGLNAIQYTRQTEYPKFQRMYNKYRYMPFSYIYLGYNLKDSRFADRRVRQALTYAINKTGDHRRGAHGPGRGGLPAPISPAPGITTPMSPNSPTIRLRPRPCWPPPGWQPNADGVLTKDGRPFAFTILTNQGNDTRQRTAEIIQSRLRAVGILVKIRQVEWAAFLKDFIEKGNYEAVLLGWNTGLDPDQFDIWHSTKTKPGELNFIDYKNPQVDALLAEGRHTFDREKRRQAYFRFQEILAEDQPYTFLFVPDALPAISRRFRGIKPAPAGIDYNFNQVVRPQGRPEVHPVPVLSADGKDHRPNRKRS